MESVVQFLDTKWDNDCIPRLEEYIKIPCQSPAFDPEWETNGLLDQAMDLLHDWVKEQDVPGLTTEVFREPGKTPFFMGKIPATSPSFSKQILMYGHMDKQPPLRPWAEGLDPYVPVVRDGKLYGRGGADDGYAIFAAITSIQALQKTGIPHGNITIVVEADEESGSQNLTYWIEHLKPQLSSPDLIICLDSGTLNYDQLWLASSLRGALSGTLEVQLLSEGVHSGIFGGIVPCPFSIVRQLLSRIENEMTGEVTLPEAHVEIPAYFVEHAKKLDEFGPGLLTQDVPFLEGCCGFQGTNSELYLTNTWKPSVVVTGISGLPPIEKAGNVLQSSIAVALSVRIPPTADSAVAINALRQTLERDPPFNAKVTFRPGYHVNGWAAPVMEEWLDAKVEEASQLLFGKSYRAVGFGGTVPFMSLLGHIFPNAQFVMAGIVGPKCNAHGPNECLHIAYTKKVTACVASIVAAHYRHFSS